MENLREMKNRILALTIRDFIYHFIVSLLVCIAFHIFRHLIVFRSRTFILADYLDQSYLFALSVLGVTLISILIDRYTYLQQFTWSLAAICNTVVLSGFDEWKICNTSSCHIDWRPIPLLVVSLIPPLVNATLKLVNN